MRGNFSFLHSAIAENGFEAIFMEYKQSKVRDFAEKYRASNSTILDIFGPKMTKSKKRVIQILKQEGEQGRIKEIAERNIL